MAARTSNPMLALSKREETVQKLLSTHHRKMVAQFMTEQYESSIKDDQTCGVFLSGGIDSGSMVFSLIEDCGKTIHDAYTAVIENESRDGFIESADYIRAKKICDYYDIRHHVIVIPRDPDYICNKMVEIASNYPVNQEWLKSRSDFEVMVMYFACVDKAAEQNNSAIFSGLLDGSIHLHSRKLSVPNKKRETAYGHYRMAIEPMHTLSQIPAQSSVITQRCEEHNMTIHLSHSAIAAQYPYMYLPWRVINRPRDKWISIMAYADDYKKTTGSHFPYTKAMQVGDSGAREFFDSMVAQSAIPDELVGRKVTTSKVFTNALAVISRKNMYYSEQPDEFPYMADTVVPEEALDDMRTIADDPQLSKHVLSTYGDTTSAIRWLEYLTAGGEKPGTKHQIDDDTGRLTMEHIPEDSFLNPFAYIGKPVTREKIYAMNDDGEADDRVDCFGSPLHRGPAFANTECPRAQAGLCGFRSREEDDEKPELHKCTVLDTWGSAVSRSVWNFPAADDDEKNTNREWSASSTEVLLMLKSGAGSFIKNQEKFFL